MNKKNRQEQFYLHLEKLIGGAEARQLVDTLEHKHPKAVRYNPTQTQPQELTGDPVPWCQPYGRYWTGEIFPS